MNFDYQDELTQCEVQMTQRLRQSDLCDKQTGMDLKILAILT